MPRGQAEDAKRALVATLKSLARTYGLPVQLTRDAPDAAVRAAYRRVFRRAHPDKGGSLGGRCLWSTVLVGLWAQGDAHSIER